MTLASALAVPAALFSAALTEPGGHVVNEDAFEVQPHPLDPDSRLGAAEAGYRDRLPA